MMNSNNGGRGGAPEAARPEPRTPVSRPEARLPEARAADARAAEVRVPSPAAPERHSEARPEAPRASVLGPTLKFRGELSAQEDLVVQCSVDGSITHTQSLTIGTDGSMKGDIRARVILIDGKVDGDLYATESVNIRATAKVRGNVFAPRVAISDGAFFQGQIEMKPTGILPAESTEPSQTYIY